MKAKKYQSICYLEIEPLNAQTRFEVDDRVEITIFEFSEFVLLIRAREGNDNIVRLSVP